MIRGLAIVAVLAGRAAAEPGGETLTVDAHAYLSFIGPMAGGSLHFEHRFADSPVGVTLRASGSAGQHLDVTPFSYFTALVGVRRHWGALYGEAGAGWGGLRDGRISDALFPGDHYGVVWHQLPDLELAFGGRIGPVDLSVITAIPVAGIGLRLGIAIDD